MSEVKRYKYEEDYDTGPSLFCEPADLVAVDGQTFVLAVDYDAAQVELSGYRAANMVLRDELAAERLRADTAAADANEAERNLAALREEMAGANRRLGACINQIEEQQQRLAAAEQRNAEQLQGLVKARGLIEQASNFRASTFSDCSDLILSLQAFVAETKHAGEYVAVRRDLLNTACNGYAQEQGHAINELRDILAALKPTESGASE